METTFARRDAKWLGRTGRFVVHYFEMCIPMCMGFAVGDLVYFWVAGLVGYSEPFSDLPVPIVAVGLLVLGAVGLVALDQLALLEHGLMMPAMLAPMLLRPDLYSGHLHHAAV